MGSPWSNWECRGRKLAQVSLMLCECASVEVIEDHGRFSTLSGQPKVDNGLEKDISVDAADKAETVKFCSFDHAISSELTCAEIGDYAGRGGTQDIVVTLGQSLGRASYPMELLSWPNERMSAPESSS